ncbi:hypothetical protein FKP32DRAFT_225395 [Trametes sanguinea]|nr:hypothetical protein FKP32DRAFT_225395 [Trametes sanguinea]
MNGRKLPHSTGQSCCWTVLTCRIRRVCFLIGAREEVTKELRGGSAGLGRRGGVGGLMAMGCHEGEQEGLYSQGEALILAIFSRFVPCRLLHSVDVQYDAPPWSTAVCRSPFSLGVGRIMRASRRGLLPNGSDRWAYLDRRPTLPMRAPGLLINKRGLTGPPHASDEP